MHLRPRSVSYALGFLLLALMLLAGCGGDERRDPTDPEPVGPVVAAISVAPKGTFCSIGAFCTVHLGETLEMEAIIIDTAGVDHRGLPVTWSVDDESIATISTEGVLTPHQLGLVQVSATYADSTGHSFIQVLPTRAVSIEVTVDQPTIPVGGTATVTAVVRGKDGQILTDNDVLFFTTNDSLVSVTVTDGTHATVSGLADGLVIIVAGVNMAVQDYVALRVGTPGAAAPGFRLATVAVGGTHACGADPAGIGWCWGHNRWGQLGNGTRGMPWETFFPTQVVDVTGLTRFALGESHSCALDGAGKAYCWGSGPTGELGNGLHIGGSATPLPVSGDFVFTDITAGTVHTCGLVAGGQAYCWGHGGDGELGGGNWLTMHTPMPVTGGHAFQSISAGLFSTCALDLDGKAWCWGSDEYGQVGDGGRHGTGVAVNEPTAVSTTLRFTQLRLHGAHACALTAQGEAWCWGRNEYGQLGNGSVGNQPTPVRVQSPVAFTQIGTGAFYSCGLDAGGKAWCWGNNEFGTLGDGTLEDRHTPVPVSGDYTFTTLVVGPFTSCGLRPNGETYCWGSNYFGAVGNGSAGRDVDMSVEPMPVRQP
ncbi:MAG TPA: hypothetical protein VNK43_06190 [Gemmatimonadales bacterium]|nr:hypothetical protein [Gemmatimonadales bacterium]